MPPLLLSGVARRWALRLALLALLAGGLALVAWNNQRLRAARDEARHALLAARAEAAGQQAAFEARMRQLEREQHQAMAQVGQLFEEKLDEMRNTHAEVVAALDAGTVRLRAHWQACTATAALSRAADTAARADEAARLRAQGAAALVSIGHECDARIRALQGAVRVYAGGGR